MTRRIIRDILTVLHNVSHKSSVCISSVLRNQWVEYWQQVEVMRWDRLESLFSNIFIEQNFFGLESFLDNGCLTVYDIINPCSLSNSLTIVGFQSLSLSKKFLVQQLPYHERCWNSTSIEARSNVSLTTYLYLYKPVPLIIVDSKTTKFKDPLKGP